MKGQSSLEFLIIIGLVLTIFIISILIYFMNISEYNQIADKMDAVRLCSQVSSAFNSVAAMGKNTSYTFDLPNYLNYETYSILVVSNSNSLKITYENSVVGCVLNTRNITNSTGSTLFQMNKNATIINYGGIIIVE